MISPYVYVGNNPINIIDPSGMDWYTIKNKDEELIYKYSLDIHSQKDLDKVEPGEIYLEKTYSKDDTYYSLFGTKENLKETQGELTQKIDEAIINYDEAFKKEKKNKHRFFGGEDIDYEKSTNFDIGVYQQKSGIGLNEGMLLKANYQGARFIILSLIKI